MPVENRRLTKILGLPLVEIATAWDAAVLAPTGGFGPSLKEKGTSADEKSIDSRTPPSLLRVCTVVCTPLIAGSGQR